MTDWSRLPPLIEQLRPLRCHGAMFMSVWGGYKEFAKFTPLPDQAKKVAKGLKDKWWLWTQIKSRFNLTQDTIGRIMTYLNHNQYVESKWVKESGKQRKQYKLTAKGREWVEQ